MMDTFAPGKDRRNNSKCINEGFRCPACDGSARSSFLGSAGTMWFHAKRDPSCYGRWGIQKFFIDRETGRPGFTDW